MAEELNLNIERLHRFEGDSKLKAFVDLSVGNFVVKGLKIVEGKKGLFLSMPQEKGKDGKWYNVFYPKTEEARQAMNDLVLAAYQE